MTLVMTGKDDRVPGPESLLLSVPAQYPSTSSAIESDPRRLRQWLADLPVTNIEDTVQRLHCALESFNALELSGAVRLKLLELYRGAYDEILYLYDELRVRALPIPTEQRQLLARDIMRLYLVLADGYKILVRDAHEASSRPVQDSAMPLAIYRASELIVHGVIYAHRTRQAIPPLSCLELHQLYRCAEHHGVLAKKMRAVRHESTCPTVEHLYKKFLLIALADPRAMDGGELMELYTALDGFAGLSRISPPDGRPITEAHGYRIALREDALPTPAVAGVRPEDEEKTRWLDVHPVIEALNRWLGAERVGIGNERHLLRQLADQLAKGEGQHNAGVHRKVHLMIGLEAVSHCVGSANRRREGSALRDEPCTNGEPAAFVLSDESADGCQLRGPVTVDGSRPGVGELVAIIEPVVLDAGVTMLRVGLVRWAREAGGVNQIGLEYLPPGPLPVACTADGMERPALYFPRDAAAERPATVLVEQALFYPRRALSITAGARHFEVAPARVVVETPLFVLFSYRASQVTTG